MLLDAEKFSLRDYTYENNIPINATIELLTECNLNCIHCYLPNHENRGLDFTTIKRILIDLRKSGTLSLIYTGGEIFLREDIFDILKFSRSLHFRIYLMSTATLLDEEKIIMLSELNICEFSTSVYSLVDDIHDSITMVPGSLKKTLENLKLLKKHGISVEVKTPIMQINKDGIEELQDYCKRCEYKLEITPAITVKNNGDDTPIKLRINEDDLFSVVNVIESNRAVKELKPFDLNAEPCKWIYGNYYIDSNGDMFPCNSFLYKVGNVLTESVKDIWNNSEQLKYIKSIRNKDLTECSECSVKNYCNRCPGLALHEENDLLGCTKLGKCIAVARSKVFENRTL